MLMSMEAIIPHAVFVGPEVLGRKITEKLKNVEFTATLSSFDALWDALDKGYISDRVQILIFSDALYERFGKDEEFEKTVSIMAPYCFLAIVSHNPLIEDEIRTRISAVGQRYGFKNYDEYAFIDYNLLFQKFIPSMCQYVKTTKNKWNANLLFNYFLNHKNRFLPKNRCRGNSNVNNFHKRVCKTLS